MDFFAGRVGYVNGETLVLDSSFDYGRQVKLFLARKLPEPSEEGFVVAAADQIKRFIIMTRGRAFVLFTSYSMLKDCAELLAPFLHEAGVRLLTQGDGMTRSAMIKEFKRDEGAVIFGTTSFWTGVDVPGDALSNVMIVKLPTPCRTITRRARATQTRRATPLSRQHLPKPSLISQAGPSSHKPTANHRQSTPR
jgi:ATP-dependent DNA helicase DinG